MFDNIEIAFKDKSDEDLNRAYLLFKTISNPIISNILTVLVKIAMWLHLPINSIIKATVYKHFCGGTNIYNSQATIDKLWASHIGTILDFSAEGKESETDFNRAMNETIESIKKANKEISIPFSVFKPTGLARFSLLEKISNKQALTQAEEIEKEIFEKRIETICRISSDHRVPLFIDAEESWIQDAIDEIAVVMMKKFNKKEAWIFNTLQLYRNDRLNQIEILLKTAKEEGFFLGIKLVRGAYHEKEIKRAREKGYACPVYLLKEETDNDYNKALTLCIENIDIISFCAGTHNEESSILLTELLKRYNIPRDDKRVYFSQLLGMSDHISYNAAKEGFNVVKYVPYGPVKDVLPYLIRRAEENTSISGQMGRELTNIIEEKKRRKNN
ncbi:MAG: proline dehydrogenase [Flavobacteriales bacterium]|nr:proline dehydrogenase [Flavobacteriales bacterium]|tara:strand:+ start:10536 stop:11696 length:1161 start_codon:yes stop_codon:yes gene_type:complete